jgi:hypothetical protein
MFPDAFDWNFIYSDHISVYMNTFRRKLPSNGTFSNAYLAALVRQNHARPPASGVGFLRGVYFPFYRVTNLFTNAFFANLPSHRQRFITPRELEQLSSHGSLCLRLSETTDGTRREFIYKIDPMYQLANANVQDGPPPPGGGNLLNGDFVAAQLARNEHPHFVPEDDAVPLDAMDTLMLLEQQLQELLRNLNHN